MQNIEIKAAGEDDYVELREIFLRVRRERFTWEDRDRMSLRDFDESVEGEEVLAAWIGPKIVGFVSVWEEDKFIHNLFVLQEYRGLHIGRKLLDTVVRKYGSPLTLKCVKENRQSAAYYLNHGWTIKEEGECRDGMYYVMVYHQQSQSGDFVDTL